MARTRQSIEQLAELLDGGVDAADVPGEISQLATLATSLRGEVDLPTPDPAFREALRTQILTAPGPGTAGPALDAGRGDQVRRFVQERVPELAQSGRVVAATTAVAAVVATGGVGTLAQRALPGDLLYPIKGATEDLRLSFASGDAERGQLHLRFAEERLEELEDGIARLTTDLVGQTLDDFDDEVVAAATDLLAAFEATADQVLVDDLRAFTQDAGARLTEIQALLPPEVAGRVDDSIEVLRRVEIQADVVTGVAQECDCEPAASSPPHDSIILRPGEGPALASSGCECVATPTPTGETSEPASAASPAPEQQEPAPEPTEPPADEDPETVPQLPEPVEPIGNDVEAVVDDLLDQLPVDPVEELPDPIQESVEETQETVNETVGEVSETIDDILPDGPP